MPDARLFTQPGPRQYRGFGRPKIRDLLIRSLKDAHYNWVTSKVLVNTAREAQQMGLASSLEISASGLTAQRLRMEVIANNLANINTTRTEKGGPYRRQTVMFTPASSSPFRLLLARAGVESPALTGVQVSAIEEDKATPRLVYDPQHPDHNEEGYVAYPNINIVTEMIDIMLSRRAYEANATVIEALKSMALKALEIGRR